MLNVFLPFTNTFLRLLFFLAGLIPQLLQKSQALEIKAKQKSHEFRFGANLFMLDELETEEKNEKYKKHFADVFNMATLPFYWDATEPEKEKTRNTKTCRT